ncbi:MAG TPA: SgcJ/EcaC family oxidoreductase [Longimicrobiales bacterium]|nr:SgcJ/EcaC family oxidoreductase [Longimicrobiales bacterium]
MRRFPVLSMLLIPLVLVACDMEEPADEGVATGMAASRDAGAAEARVAQLRDAWIEGARASNAATVASLYAEDAVMVGADGQVSEGRQAIHDALDFEGMTHLQINSTDMEVGSEVASDMGTFTQGFQTAVGQQTLTGRYLVVLRLQEDGSWKITQHLAVLDPDGMQMDTAGMQTDTADVDTAAAQPR